MGPDSKCRNEKEEAKRSRNGFRIHERRFSPRNSASNTSQRSPKFEAIVSPHLSNSGLFYLSERKKRTGIPRASWVRGRSSAARKPLRRGLVLSELEVFFQRVFPVGTWES